MSSHTASPEARERQLLVAAVRQLARSRLADHTLGGVLFAALGAVLYLGVYVVLAAAAPELRPRDWASTPLAMGLSAAAAVGWLAAAAGVAKSALAVAQPGGRKSLAWLALFVGLGLLAGPALAFVAM